MACPYFNLMSEPATSASTSTATQAPGFSLSALAEALRPAQWVKNGFVFAALIFSQNLFVWERTERVALAALLFSLVASAFYLVNDVLDAKEDQRHPSKSFRPIACGRLSARVAITTALCLAVGGLTAAWFLDHAFFLVLAFYAALSGLYSSFLKHVILLDVFVIAGGFVCRVVAGGVVIHVEISPWLIVCTTMLALFLALTKRRHELVSLGAEAGNHRASLARYTPYFLDQLIGIVTASTLMSYSLYTLSADAMAKFPGKRLELTIPFVLLGIFRYLYLVHQASEGGNPTRLLLTDRVLVAIVLLWVASVAAIIYT
jgi:4-hydroxybenzoate polyprenyltransferase